MTIYKLMATVRQTQMIQSKVVMIADLKTVLVGSMVTFVVDDNETAIVKIAGLPYDMIERSMEGILSLVSATTPEEIQRDRRGFNLKLTHRVSKALNGYGVHVEQAS